MAAIRPPDDELRRLSAHVVYEWEMLLRLAEHLRKSPATEEAGKVVDNACLESFLVHARQVALFFHHEQVGRQKRDDIYAYQYVSDWENKCLPWTPTLAALKETVDKMIAHLTTRRVANHRREVARWTFDLGQHILTFEVAVSPKLFPAKRTTDVPRLLVADGEGVTTTTGSFTKTVFIRTE